MLANVDFGHTSPLVTLPIGGRVELSVLDVVPAPLGGFDTSDFWITRH